jgi:hypothetical protein
MADQTNHTDDAAHEAHDAHGHAPADRNFEIIPENSGADGILNFAAWLACIVLFIFSMIMVLVHPHEAEAGNQAPAAESAPAPGNQ